jgi:hypothetical protein
MGLIVTLSGERSRDNGDEPPSEKLMANWTGLVFGIILLMFIVPTLALSRQRGVYETGESTGEV